MNPQSVIDEIRARLQLAQGTPTLLLAVVESDATLPVVRDLLLSILRATPMNVADLGICESTSGPARWAELTSSTPAAAFALTVVPKGPLAVRAFGRLLNAERELLRRLAGPTLLLVARDTEKGLRDHSPDFFTWIASTYELPSVAELKAIAGRVGVPLAEIEPQAPLEEPVRFLHISDLHLRPQRTKKYDQDRVLDGLIAFLERDRADFPLDLIFVTGDLAQSGRAEEYVLVADLLRKLMEITGVPRERVFVVPGNHDVDRDVGKWLLRTLAKDEESVLFFEEPSSRKFHEQKLATYKQQMSTLLGEDRAHGLGVGAGAVESLEIKGSRISIASFNSAWFAQGDDDNGKLWLGEPSVERALDRIADEDSHFAIALMHHPFDHLHEVERDIVERWFERGFDLVLRGHLHADKTRSIASQRGGFVEVASPATYQGSQWPNGCFLGEIRARSHKVRLMPFTFASGPDPWVLDTKVFPDDAKDGYCHEFIVPQKARLGSGASRMLRGAVETLFKSATRLAQQRYAARIASVETAPSPGQATATARALAVSPELWTEALAQDASGLTLAQAIVEEARSAEWRAKRISYGTDPDALAHALALAGSLFLRVASRRDPRPRLRERDANLALATALGAMTDATIAVDAPIGASLRADIVLGVERAKADVIEVRNIEIRKKSARAPGNVGLLQLDRYLAAGIFEHGALVLLNQLQRDETAPRIEHTKTPGGVDVLLVHL